MRRWWILAILLTTVGAWPSPAGAQTTLGTAAQALRGDPVYVAPERQGDVSADDVRARIRAGQAPIFVAVLPASALDEVGGDASRLPATLGQDVGLRGTYAVVAGNSFRAASNALPRGQAASLATAAFQTASDRGPNAVLDTFIDRVNGVAAGTGQGARTDGGSGGTGSGGTKSGSGGAAILAVAALGGGGFLLWRRSRRRREEQVAVREEAADRQMLQAELSVLADDVIALEGQVSLHPEAREDYDAGVTRYKAAQAALEYANGRVDLVRVGRVVEEGRYAMSRARARIEGREPPPPPTVLTQPGRRDEPALDLDDRGQPVYVGFGSPFYGGGWFGGGGGLLTGLMLGSMLGGGWGGGWGGGGWDSGPGDGGDWGGDVGDGGGDFGGGDFGGGDFGGGDVGGGDW